MGIWETLVTTALVGTERQSLVLPPQSSAIDALLAQLDQQNREASLLCAAAIVALRKRAGQIPLVDSQPLPPSSEPEDLPRCNAAAAQHLKLMIDGINKEFLSDWLTAVAASGKRIQEELLPAVISLGRIKSDLRESIRGCIGQRGFWLASQNPDWSWVGITTDDESVWETGTSATRLSLIQGLRKTDPKRARELVMSTWSEDTPDDRLAFVGSFATNLSMDDEPMLEDILNDRRKEVRRAAADLLSRLPESRFVHRMIARMENLLLFEQQQTSRFLGLKKEQKLVIEVRLPDSCDKAMLRDGTEPKPRQGMGEKAWWLLQMIATIPPRLWLVKANATPEQLVQTAMTHEWKTVLLEGWSQAAERYRDAAWAEALLDGWIGREIDPGTLHARAVITMGLMAAISATQRESLVTTVLRNLAGPLHGHPALMMLRHCRHQWSGEFSRFVLRRIKDHISESNDPYDYELRGSVKSEFSRFVDLSAAEEFEGALPTTAPQWEGWSKVIDEFLSKVRFRREMVNAVNDEPGHQQKEING